jgi:TonB family protein
VLAVPPGADAQQAEIDTLAQQIAESIHKLRQKQMANRVVVVDFSMHGGQVTALGSYLADELSRSLASLAQDFQVLDRSALLAFLEAKKVSPAEFRNDNVSRWASGQLGADAVAVGDLTKKDKEFSLSVTLLETKTGKKLSEAHTKLPKTEKLQELQDNKTGLNWHPAAPSPCTGASPGKNGVSFPKPVFCPDPKYSRAARDAKIQGVVVLSVLIGADGRATDIQLVKGGLPFGLSEEAIATVQTWRFKPATNQDGTPVPVCVIVEASFRLF